MQRKDLMPIAIFEHTGTQSAGNQWETTKRLDRDQCAEIYFMEIFAPVSDGTYEELERIIPVIDGKTLEDYINIPGKYDKLFTPPYRNTVNEIFWFGSPGQRDPRTNTTLKATRRVGVRTYAGSTDVTADYKIILWGTMYEEDAALQEVFGEGIYNEDFPVAEDIRDKYFVFSKAFTDVYIDTFDQLVGGIKQDMPRVMPWATFATNAKATTANQLYEFSAAKDNVANDWENLAFDTEWDTAYIIENTGIIPPDNLLKQGWLIKGDQFPPDLYPADPQINKWPFGLADDYGYSTANWFSLPALDYPMIVHDEYGALVVQDNGTSIGSDNIVVAASGWLVEEVGAGPEIKKK